MSSSTNYLCNETSGEVAKIQNLKVVNVTIWWDEPLTSMMGHFYSGLLLWPPNLTMVWSQWERKFFIYYLDRPCRAKVVLTTGLLHKYTLWTWATWSIVSIVRLKTWFDLKLDFLYTMPRPIKVPLFYDPWILETRVAGTRALRACRAHTPI